jgi:hypothetical protein
VKDNKTTLERIYEKIQSMDSISLMQFTENVMNYSVHGETRTKILEACQDKLLRLSRDSIMAENGELDDVDIL